MTAFPSRVSPERGVTRSDGGAPAEERRSSATPDIDERHSAAATHPLLEVTDLEVSLSTEAGVIQAVRGITLSLGAGETLGVVGESGSGKTMLSLAILGLLPSVARVTGSVRLDGEELLTATPKQWNRVRGARAAMVFQDPMTALNPMFSVGWQVAECVRLHSGIDRGAPTNVLSNCSTSSASPSRHSLPAATHTSYPAA